MDQKQEHIQESVPGTTHEEDTCMKECPHGGQESRNQDGKNSTSQFYLADRCAVVDF